MENENTYKKIVDVKSEGGDLKKQISVTLSPYDTSKMESFKDGDKIYKGHTCQIKVTKFGNNPKTSYVNIDPSDKEVKKAILQMYAEFEALK